jgi:hypothetical protein
MSWDRTAVAALPLLLPVGFLGMMLGQTVWPLAAVGAAELGLLGLARRSDRRVPEGQWRPPSHAVDRASSPTRPASPVLGVARVEIRELLLSPWFQAGVAFCAIFLVGITSYERSWWGTAALMPLLVHPLCGFTIIAVHRNVSRARRDGTRDLLDAYPATVEQRMVGHLLAGVVPMAVATAFVAVSLVGTSIVLDDIYGPVDARVATDVVIACALLPLGATALGVLLGRRFPAQIVPIFALAVIAIVNLEFWDEPDGRGWLATGLPSPSNDLVYIDPPNPGRLAWLVGLVVIVAVAAGAVRRGPARTIALSCGAVVAIGGIVLTALGPSDATAQRLADYVLLDDRTTECADVSRAVEVCVPEPYGEHGATIAAWVAPVADAVPVDQAQPIRMWLLADDIEHLQGKVRERIDATPLPPNVIALPFGHHESHLAAARLSLAARTVGIAVGPDAPQNVLVDGEARGVVMLWLVANELDDRDVDRLLTPQDSREGASYRGHLWPGICEADVQWSPQDVDAARTVVALDRAVVADVLAADWKSWVDPATTTDDLLMALAVPPVGPHEPIEALGDTCS